METIKLDRKEIESKIEHGDGNYVLAVAPDGSNCRVHWAENNRQWNSWPDSWEHIIEIPALDPEGSGRESDDAQDVLRVVLGNEGFEAAKTRYDSGDIGWPALAEELAAEDWKVNREENTAWLAEAFLAACNGDGTDLENPNPWGYREICGDIEYLDPPAEFEWA